MKARDSKTPGEDLETKAAQEELLDVVELPDEVGGFARGRVELVRKAVKEWTQRLVDLGGRNNLLHFRELKLGTLSLASADSTAVSALFQGKRVRISELFPSSEAREDALRRARSIHKKAKENFDERGIETLFLGCGLATWENQRGAWVPSAPVLLCRAEIRRLGAAEGDLEVHLVDEMEVNATFLQALRVNFDCSFSEEELLKRIDGTIDEQWKLSEVYEWIRKQAKGVPNFHIEHQLVIANFAYAKLPMVRDLEQAFDQLVGHDLVAAIAGDEQAREAVREAQPDPGAIPDPSKMPVTDEFLILDADSSQSIAINAVNAGANLIIRGPPGTGKSQTIANLIGSLVARGKKVLFVAEKRAAIDAVLKRLRQTGLDDLVLDLHGGIATRRAFAEAIGRAVRRSQEARKVDNERDVRRLEKQRAQLDKYRTTIHEERQPWGKSVYELRTELMGLQRRGVSNEIRFRAAALDRMDRNLTPQIEEDLVEYIRLGGLGPRVRTSAWSNSTITTQDEVKAAYELVKKIDRDTVPRVLAITERLQHEVCLSPAICLADWELRLRIIDRVGTTLDIFHEAIYEEDLQAIVDALEPAGRGVIGRFWALLVSSEYRRARRAARALLTNKKKKDSDAELLLNSGRALEELQQWQDVGGLASPRYSETVDEAWESFEAFCEEIGELEALAGKQGLMELSPPDLRREIRELIEDRATLIQLPELHRLRSRLEEAGLAELLAEMELNGAVDEESCLANFRYSWLQSILDKLAMTDPLIEGFVAERHSKTVEDFKASDRAYINAAPERIIRLCAEEVIRVRDEWKNQDEIIRWQAGLRRGHMPVRDLINQAFEVLLALKPCWAMSPLVVSQLLPARTAFDVVIFDEASQVTPEDAVASILRGKQLVMAGDERQLPPTSFFIAELPDEDEDIPESGEPPAVMAGTRGFESILDVFNVLFRPRMLEWHYRSKDERLIAFSNVHLYGGALTTFPGVGDEEVLQFVEVPWDPTSGSNSPSPEVEAVVQLVLQHARNRPNESLGVIAMGIRHANRIEEYLRNRLRHDPSLEEELADYLDEDREEPFFIKNLERVQGDERDAIILSVGYGKNARGDLVYRFGPLLSEGGERRLNVAVTRARRRITLVASFSSKDMDPERSSAPGVQLLRQYLQYVESQGLNFGDMVRDKPHLNAFELDVQETLTRRGLNLIPQYGSSGYWIDFAVQHPSQPGRYLLAIECDGAAYHSLPSARDRDRLRQEHLERIGWRFCRIWSTEWFNNKEKAVERVLSAYNKALQMSTQDGNNRPQTALVPREMPERHSSGTGARTRQGLRRDRWPPIPRGLPIEKYTHGQLVRVARWIASDGLLRTEDEMITEMMRQLGFQRRGSNIVAALQAAVHTARRQQTS